MNVSADLVTSAQPDTAWTAGRLADPMPPLPASTTCAETYEWFEQSSGQVATAIVDGENRVVGLVNRLRFLARYSQRFVPELYGKRSIIHLANPNPLMVDEAVALGEFVPHITLEFPDSLRESFIVTRAGRYLGIGTSEALMKYKMAVLAEREAQLQSALLSAQDASQAKSNFLALMSHELRTPLNAIIGFSEILSEELFGPHSVKRYGDYAADIHGAGVHLLKLINDILDLSKLEAGKLNLELEAVDVGELLKDCQKFVTLRAEEKGLATALEVPPDLPLLRADRLRLKQIILNLLSNAIKFTPPRGDVEVGAELEADGAIAIWVRDTGVGMAPEMIPFAMEPFRQIASPMARKTEGTGLGLSLVKSLTEQHGGDVTIESALDKGTCVRVRFPAAQSLKRSEAKSA